MPPRRKFRLERGDSRPLSLLCHCWNPSVWNSGALQYRERRICIGAETSLEATLRLKAFSTSHDQRVFSGSDVRTWLRGLIHLFAEEQVCSCVSASIQTYFLVHRAMFRSINIPIEGSNYSNTRLISTPNSAARCSYQRLANDLYRLKVVVIIWQSRHQCCHWVQCRQDRAGPSRCGAQCKTKVRAPLSSGFMTSSCSVNRVMRPW